MRLNFGVLKFRNVLFLWLFVRNSRLSTAKRITPLVHSEVHRFIILVLFRGEITGIVIHYRSPKSEDKQGKKSYEQSNSFPRLGLATV